MKEIKNSRRHFTKKTWFIIFIIGIVILANMGGLFIIQFGLMLPVRRFGRNHILDTFIYLIYSTENSYPDYVTQILIFHIFNIYKGFTRVFFFIELIFYSSIILAIVGSILCIIALSHYQKIK